MQLSRYHPVWPLLIEGKITYKFHLISASMLISRLGRDYKNDQTPEAMERAIDEAMAFFQKYESLFINDLNELFKDL